MGYESMDRVALVQYRVQWWASSQPLKDFDPLLSIVLLLFFYFLVSFGFIPLLGIGTSGRCL
jgi:hypothetical protein